MNFKKLFTAALCFFICGCNSQPAEISPTQLDAAETEKSDISDLDISEESDSFSNECFITLGSNVSINGNGAWLDEDCITISQSGVYTITGEISNGMIYVQTSDIVKIVLDNAQITNKTGAAIISESGKLFIEAADGTENSLTDGKDYDFSRSFENEELHRSAVHSEGTVCFKGGTGKININARYKDAIYAEYLSIYDCTLDITADKAGITADTFITAVDCGINISSEGDCLKTENEGGITIQNSNVKLETEKDGIQSAGWFKATNGNISITTTGDINTDAELSSKGIKTADLLRIYDSTVSVSSTDHALKCGGEAEISGGKLTLSSLYGKGIAAEGSLTVNGDIDITQSVEGIESKKVITINGGNINVTAFDDGINTGGDDMTVDHNMNINGGNIVVNANGDGLDSNGNINITGGTLVVFGPDNDANSVLDCGDMGFKTTISGGTVLTMGSTGMMQQPEGSCVSSPDFSGAAGSEITVFDENSNIIVSAQLSKATKGLLLFANNAESCKITLDGAEVSVSTGFSGGMDGFDSKRGDFGGMEKPDKFGGKMPEGMEPPEGFDGAVPPELPQDGNRPENII